MIGWLKGSVEFDWIVGMSVTPARLVVQNKGGRKALSLNGETVRMKTMIHFNCTAPFIQIKVTNCFTTYGQLKQNNNKQTKQERQSHRNKKHTFISLTLYSPRVNVQYQPIMNHKLPTMLCHQSINMNEWLKLLVKAAGGLCEVDC